MPKISLICCLLLLATAGTHKAFAQDASKPSEMGKGQEAAKSEAPTHYYRLDFTLAEVGADGKPTNTRSYSTIISTDPHAKSAFIKTGSRLPIVVGATPSAEHDGRPGVDYQYIDIGNSLEAWDAHEVGRDLAFFLKAEVTSAAPPTGPGNNVDPTIRQNSWQSSVLIPVSKATVVFASDALENKGGMQVVVTATLLP